MHLPDAVARTLSVRVYYRERGKDSPAVNENVGSSGVGTGIADEVDIGALELLGITVSAHWNHAHPHVLDLLVYKVAETGVDVACCG